MRLGDGHTSACIHPVFTAPNRNRSRILRRITHEKRAMACCIFVVGDVGSNRRASEGDSHAWQHLPEKYWQSHLYGNPQTPSTALEARTFVLNDSTGTMCGEMTVDGDRHPLLEFYDLDGNVIWSTEAHAIPTS